MVKPDLRQKYGLPEEVPEDIKVGGGRGACGGGVRSPAPPAPMRARSSTLLSASPGRPACLPAYLPPQAMLEGSVRAPKKAKKEGGEGDKGEKKESKKKNKANEGEEGGTVAGEPKRKGERGSVCVCVWVGGRGVGWGGGRPHEAKRLTGQLLLGS